METDVVCAFQIEDEDFIVVEGATYQVSGINDEGDLIKFDVRDDNGEVADVPPFAPFDPVHVVTSFEEWQGEGDLLRSPDDDYRL